MPTSCSATAIRVLAASLLTLVGLPPVYADPLTEDAPDGVTSQVRVPEESPHSDADRATQAARDLLQRLLPDQADRFLFEWVPAVEGQDVFQIESQGARIVIRGNSGVSLATGLNWYLKHFCRCHVSWYGNQLALPDVLPVVEPMVQEVSWAKHRYFLNYCCFGYSLPFWDWEQWERLIDWMALNGVNLPLSVTGQEAVWEVVCRRLGISSDEIRDFLAGPPFLPFQWMGCLDGWGSPLPANWIEQHAALQQKILARQRQLGMTPVLQGFTGHVPPAISQKFPDVKLHTIRWIEWQTHLLDPLDPRFAEISRIWMEEQTKLFGTDHYYAADTFIEMTPPLGDLDYLHKLGQAIYQGMAQHDPAAIWVLQGWAFMFERSFWTQPRIEAFLSSTPDDRLLVLDLMCESRPMWNQTESFCGKPWLWCNIQDWGRRIFLGGDLPTIASELPAARRDPTSGKLIGLGFVNEGLGYNPVVYDLLYEMAWRDAPPDLDQWIAEYAHHRYGRRNEHAGAAWRLLSDTVYQDPQVNNSIIDRTPSLQAAAGTSYANADLAETWHQLLAAAPELHQVDTYRFDLVNVARQTLANHAEVLYLAVMRAYRAKDAAAFDEARDRFLGLMLDLDRLLATRHEFLLGPWLEDAKRWGDTPAERQRLEWNARRVLTLWGEGPQIDDYACKQWAGLTRDYYHQRWNRFLNALSQSLHAGEPFDEMAVGTALRQWMADWSDQQNPYPTTPHGDSVAVAHELCNKYRQAFEPDAASLTTGKPATCSHALAGHPARLANDGWSGSTERYWATDVQQQPGPAWWQVDLLEPTSLGRVVVVAFFGDTRSYGFLVETSLDGQSWRTVSDRRENTEPSTGIGYECRFEPHAARYLRVTQTSNSANSGRHLVEVMAFAD